MRTRTENNLTVIWNLMVRVTVVALLAYLVWRIRSVLITVVISATLAYALLPAVEFLTRRRILPISRRGNRLIATTLVFLAFFAVVVGAARLLISPLEGETAKFLEKLPAYTSELSDAYTKATKWYVANVPEEWQKAMGKPNPRDIQDDVKGFVVAGVQRTLGWLKNIIEIILIPVLAFYFVLDSRSLKREFIGMLPPWRMREGLKILHDVSAIMQSYVVGQIILCIIAGVVTGIVLNFLNMPYILVLAVFAAVTRAIPVIGPVISGIPICLLGLLQSTSLGISLLVFVIVMHFVESKFIMPILIGERMKLHPAVILIVLLIGAEFFGLLGMFLAAPVAAIIRELINFYIVTPRRKRLLVAAGSAAASSQFIRTETL